MLRGFVINPADNVATLLDEVEAPGAEVQLVGARSGTIQAMESIPRAHKMALEPLAEGSVGRKFGQPIGEAVQFIACGSWVHLHNCRSRYDERSSSLDQQTGAPTDTAYV